MAFEASAHEALQQRLGYEFRDRDLLRLALTHPSHASSIKEGRHNQRLEFLGDAVLGMVLAETLCKLLPEEREGTLTRYRSILVRGRQLSILARELRLGECLFLGEAEEESGGRELDSILEDALEAVIGAIYQEGGLEAVRETVHRIYGSLEERLSGQMEGVNPKGRLQELLQPTLGNDAIEYRTVSESGPDHSKFFSVEVLISGEVKGRGEGASKKLAEESAAREALDALEE